MTHGVALRKAVRRVNASDSTRIGVKVAPSSAKPTMPGLQPPPPKGTQPPHVTKPPPQSANGYGEGTAHGPSKAPWPGDGEGAVGAPAGDRDQEFSQSDQLVKFLATQPDRLVERCNMLRQCVAEGRDLGNGINLTLAAVEEAIRRSGGPLQQQRQQQQ
eukprot:CAMPEP_0115342546 /NCGR_PEP_ID=MMETSP0270-20121206/92266_1 /TAXON_ID=71861 /ORGANISM="Scrippsiella trochoidea, Strain CCMP3099" /LENGTH=158 /DNA_ID=CAMNT_0002764131 /DNA_START=43 /DNA_END=516 /DNA_ORIENTATION=+